MTKNYKIVFNLVDGTSVTYEMSAWGPVSAIVGARCRFARERNISVTQIDAFVKSRELYAI